MTEIAPANAVAATEGRIIDGNVRVPGWTFQDVRRHDPNPGPDSIYDEFTEIGDKFSVPNSWYFSEEFAQLEADKLWSRSWIFACHQAKVPDVGSCYVHSFLDHSVLVVRTAEDEFKAFRNTCPHRGNQLELDGFCGKVGKFVCPFHGATFNRDGSVHRWPYRFDFPHLDEADYGLSEIHVGVYKGFVFVNVADDPIPFDEYIDPLPALVDHLPLENWKPVAHMRKVLRCNWKIARQAFQEAIHLPIVHPQARDVAMAGGTQIDSPGRFVRRLLGPNAVPTDQKDAALSERGVLASIVQRRRGLTDEETESLVAGFDDDTRARDAMAEMATQATLATTGVDLSGRATTEIIDNLVYHVFPTFHFNVSATAPFAMFVAPGTTPDETLFDIIWFQETAPDTEASPHPERITAIAGQSWSDAAPDAPFGSVTPYVMDQDTRNMEGQQLGLRASPDGHSIFADYGESMIINDMKTLAEVLELDS